MYQRLADTVADVLTQISRRHGIDCEVSARSKEIHSFLKKAIRKSYVDPLSEIRDKAAARIIATYADALDRLNELIEERFEVHYREDKRLSTAYNELSYRGTHFEVSLREPDLASRDELAGLICEIQVRTQAEHLWSRVSHALLYKPVEEPDDVVKRRIYRLIALLEVIDSETSAARQVILSSPSFAEASMLDDLERYYYEFTSQQFDKELSLMVLTSLKSTYNLSELPQFGTLIERFVERNREKLEKLFADYQSDETGLLLHQPESFVVFERIEEHLFAVKEAWQKVLPIDLLEPIANMWGVAV